MVNEKTKYSETLIQAFTKNFFCSCCSFLKNKHKCLNGQQTISFKQASGFHTIKLKSSFLTTEDTLKRNKTNYLLTLLTNYTYWQQKILTSN